MVVRNGMEGGYPAQSEGRPGLALSAASGQVCPMAEWNLSTLAGGMLGCWLTDAGYDDGDRIYLMSYLVLMSQVIAVFNFAVWLRESHRQGKGPWWGVFQRPLPLMVTSACLFAFGLIEWLGGNLRP